MTQKIIWNKYWQVYRMNSNYITYYNILGVETNASNEEIEKAWKTKVKEMHPDKNGGHKSASEMFTYVQQAKEVLLDPKKRLQYDELTGIKPKRTSQSSPQNQKTGNSWLAAAGIGLLIGLFIGGSDSDK